MPRHDLSLQGRVARRLVIMGAEEVPDGQVAELVVATGLADMQVMRAWTPRRLGEEVEVRRLRRWDE